MIVTIPWTCLFTWGRDNHRMMLDPFAWEVVVCVSKNSCLKMQLYLRVTTPSAEAIKSRCSSPSAAKTSCWDGKALGLLACGRAKLLLVLSFRTPNLRTKSHWNWRTLHCLYRPSCHVYWTLERGWILCWHAFLFMLRNPHNFSTAAKIGCQHINASIWYNLNRFTKSENGKSAGLRTSK